MRVALAQIDPTVGDIDGNSAKIAEWIGRAAEAGAELVIFPELCVPGYPAEDLYLKPHFIAANRRAVEELAAKVVGITALVGFAEPAPADGDFRRAYNATAVLADGAVRAIYRKMRLPNYAVFDEQRYFIPGSDPITVEVAGTAVGLTICEDCWAPGPPGQAEADAGAKLIANPSGSPYHRGKGRERETMFAERAREYGAHFAFCNLVGGQDELVFDGQSLVMAPDGSVLARAAQFEEELLVCEVPGEPGSLAEPLDDIDEVYAALELGLRDYVAKNGFQHVGLALSGGIDSALVAMLAADAVGPERVTCVVMPSPHSSSETQQDARNIAANLGCELIEIEIEGVMNGYERALAGLLNPGEAPKIGEEAPPHDPARPSEPDLAAENIQARIRGNLMMALSNRHGWLVLTTGNKSEMSVGYATLYGDMAGGFAVIKDVPKGLVYELVRRRNERAGTELVPASVLERPPSAELRPEQLDSDSLPDYDLLDRILEAYVERDEGREEMIAAGMPAETVDEVVRLVDRSEYKRRQAAPGIRITPRAFGKDRRLPITNRFGG
ncbi:MAG TPA: NAD(+) synthase [Solirubrobacterales bacterium]|nr:NAD(+) synthase [Solirubrobacterales bacterium]